ncbi:Ubiquitin-protein ligase E3B [Mortierella claussenii]|nr:Ubiquitin-protein ligase E3B [Mortierella claussenii]
MFPSRPSGPDKKAVLLAQTKAERLARSDQRQQEQQHAIQEKAAHRIQSSWRRCRLRQRNRRQQRVDWDRLASLPMIPSTPALGLLRNLQLIYLLLRFHDPKQDDKDEGRLSILCKMLLSKTIIAANTDSTLSTLSTLTDASETQEDKASGKPVMQVPFQMILLHARYSELGSRYLLHLLQLCVKVVAGKQQAPLATSTTHTSPISSLGSSPRNVSGSGGGIDKNNEKGEWYLSGPELRFLMSAVDLNTYRLPESVNATIRAQMLDRGKALLARLLDSNEVFKDVSIGIPARVEALLLLQERSRRKPLSDPVEVSRKKALVLWMTAIWRCCFLLQAVDTTIASFNSNSSNKQQVGAVRAHGRQHKDNLINLRSDDSTAVGIVCHILTVPLLVECFLKEGDEAGKDDLCLQLALQNRVLQQSLDVILDLQHQQYILSTISLNDTVSLLGNLMALFRYHANTSKKNNSNTISKANNNVEPLRQQLVDATLILLRHCQRHVSATQTAEFRQYHPILSWTRVAPERKKSHHHHHYQDTPLSQVQTKMLLQQLEYLWSREFALEIFGTLLQLDLDIPSATGAYGANDMALSSQLTNTTPQSPRQVSSTTARESSGKSFFNVQRNNNSNNSSALLAMEVQQACELYKTLMMIFESQKTKILVALMYLPGSFLTRLWRFMTTLGPRGGMVIYLEAAAVPWMSSSVGQGGQGLEQEPLIAILQIFCECCARFFVTLDDDDMYEQQKTWQLSELVFMSGFLNQFCFSILSSQQQLQAEPELGVDSIHIKDNSNMSSLAPSPTPSVLPPIFYHARQVLMQLYERDCRRQFCPPNHWLLMHPTKSVFQSPLQLLASLKLSTTNSFNSISGGKNRTLSNSKSNGLFSFGSSSSSSSTPSSTKPSSAAPHYATPKEFILKVANRDRTALQILETMPHVIPFTARLEIFRGFIQEDKAQRARTHALIRPDLHQSVMIRVRRGFILEDGFEGLRQVSNNEWKNTMRVKFLSDAVGGGGGGRMREEMGIDQGGPFKEFMEMFLEAGFSPDLNLFTSSAASMNLLYPSPTSQFTHPSNGLELLKVCGKMLSKALYEGVLVEIKFANFFLSKLLGRTVFLDEMRSYDEQVYKNLMFVKKYNDGGGGDGNGVEDLGLVFALDEEVFGQHRTVELLSGGKDMAVTKENRIHYIFKVSDYRLNKQIQGQSKAFIEGFRSIIPPHWIAIFSPQELQRVISGEDVDFDVQDLRTHTEYHNGYFDQHPVIRNLWSVLNDFSSEEKRAFLKFVTGCSKPPLGGFKHLYPPFSIRLILNPTTSDLNHDGTVTGASSRRLGSGAGTPSSSASLTSTSTGTSSSRSEQQERRQLAATSVKSFFGGILGNAGLTKESESAGKKARLPTSSTCFNLLKLPPFTSKSVLKEKLRYAILSNTGFELS